MNITIIHNPSQLHFLMVHT